MCFKVNGERAAMRVSANSCPLMTVAGFGAGKDNQVKEEGGYGDEVGSKKERKKERQFK